MPRIYQAGMNVCPLCSQKPTMSNHSIYCRCGLNIVRLGDETKKNLTSRWNRLLIGEQAAAKIAMQRKEIEALSKRVAV